MPYIGNTAADRFVASKAATQFSGDGSTTAFTLEHSVGADEDILVSVDGVVQEPSVAYAVSGTTLTFTAAPSTNSGNNIFVYYLFRTVGTVDHPATSALSATSGTFSTDLTVDTSTLKVDSTNNRVGVGTASPSQSLEVAGNIFVNTSGNPNLTVKTSGAGNNPTIRIQADTNYWDLQTLFSNSTDDLDFQYNGTSTMKIDNTGAVTKPKQPAFNVTKSGDQSNIAVGSVVAVTFDTEYFDQNADFGSNVFTAPVDGKYQFNVLLALGAVDIDASFIEIKLVTSNRTYTTASLTPKSFDLDADYHALTGAYLVDMDANDTSSVSVFIYQGAAQTDIRATQSLFSGYLVA